MSRQRDAADFRRRNRGRVADQLVRSWTLQQRARIRLSLLQLRWFGQDTGEMQVVQLIDQINGEERCG